MLTLDASVWLNADSPAEPNHPASRALLDYIASTQLFVIVPTLLLAEVAGVISRTRSDSILAQEYARSMIALPFIRWIPLDDALAAQAYVLAANHALRGSDAVYASVALSHGCDRISLDHEHLTRLSPVLNTLTPSTALAKLKTNGR